MLSSPLGPTPTISQSMATARVSLEGKGTAWGQLCRPILGSHVDWNRAKPGSRSREMAAHCADQFSEASLIPLMPSLPLECHSPIKSLLLNQHLLHRLGLLCFKSQVPSGNFCCFRPYCCFNIFWINIIKPDVSPGKNRFNYI